MNAWLLNQEVPDLLDVELLPVEQISRYVLVDPPSRRELALVKAAHLVEGWVEFYRVERCRPEDPDCIRYDGKPIGRKFVKPDMFDGKPRRPTYRKYRPFDVMERGSGAMLKQVRPSKRAA